MTFKICNKCNIDKDLGEFYRDWETVLDMQRNIIFQGFINEEDKWW